MPGYHPMEGWGDHGGINGAFWWEYRFGPLSDGTFNLEIANLEGGKAFFVNGLDQGVVYCVETHFTRKAAHTYDVRLQVDEVLQEDEATGILWVDANIHDDSLRTFFLGNNDPGYGSNEEDTDPTRWRNFAGSPVSGGPYFDLDSMRWGSLLVATVESPTDWYGPYSAGRGH